MTTPSPTIFPNGVDSNTDIMKSGVKVASFDDVANLQEDMQNTNNAAQAAISTLANAENAISGVTADANAAKVLITAALNGTSPLTYKGYWDANTNTPKLVSGTGSDGDIYIVSVAGSTNLDGNDSWNYGDAAWYNNGKWVYFERAGFAAFAQELYASGAITTGNNRLSDSGGADFAHVWIDSTAQIIALLTSDGSLVSYGSTARIAGQYITNTGLSDSGRITIGADFSVLKNETDAVWPGIYHRPKAALYVEDRPPSQFDDSTYGYQTGDTWRHKKTLYQCVNNGQGGAVWKIDPSGIDAPYNALFPNSVLSVWSLKRAIPSYTGNLIDVQIKVSGEWSSATSIGQNSDGSLDIFALNSVLAQRDAGTRAAVVKWYDQSGSYDLTANPDTAPHIGETTVNGAPAISYDTTGSGVAQSLTNSSLSLPQSGFSVLTVGRYSGTNTSLGENVAMITVGSGMSNRISTVTGLKEDGRVGVYTGSTGWVNGTMPQKTTPSVSGIIWNGTSIEVIHGSITDSLSVSSSTVTSAITGLSFGCLTHGDGDTGNPSNLIITEACAVSSALSDSSLLTYNSAMAVRHELAPQAPYEWHAIGDSRTAGYINQDGYNWPAIAIEEGYLDTPPALYNWAVSGSTTVDFAGYTQSSVVAAIQAATRPVICTIWLGVNDYGKLGASPALVAQRIGAICDALQAAGAQHIFVLNEVDAESQGMFSAVLGHLENVTLINPFSPDMPLYNQADTSLWHTDKTHPLPDADRTIAAFVSDKINSFFRAK